MQVRRLLQTASIVTVLFLKRELVTLDGTTKKIKCVLVMKGESACFPFYFFYFLLLQYHLIYIFSFNARVKVYKCLENRWRHSHMQHQHAFYCAVVMAQISFDHEPLMRPVTLATELDGLNIMNN